MSTAIKAHDLSKYQRLFTVDGGRATGTFKALGFPDDPAREGVWVTTVEVTVWDEGRHSGVVLYSDDLTVQVFPGAEPVLQVRNENKLADVLDAQDDFVAALRAVASEFKRVQAATS